MREILESHLQINVNRSPSLLSNLMMSERQSLSCQPLLWCALKCLSKIPIEGRQTSPREIAEFLQRQIEHVVAFHKLRKLDLSRFFEVCEDVIHTGIDRSEYRERLHNFQGGYLLWKLVLNFEIGNQ